MKKYLDGKRVYLRPFEEGDAIHIYEALLNSEFRKLTGTQTFFAIDDIKAAYEKFKEDRTRLDFTIVLKETGAVIGDVALNEIDYLNNNGNVRIGIYDQEHYGKGYGPEALQLLLEYGFEVCNLYRISLNVFEYNKRAIKAYEKLGFVKEGVLRGELLYDGTYYDNILMSILRPEFKTEN